MKLISLMDHYNLFIKFRELHHSIIIFITTLFLAFLLKPSLSVDSQFEACEPKKCGENLTVRYPFWIPSEQEPYCGHPSLEILCKDDKPMLVISDDQYIVQDIFYQNQSSLVVNAKAFDDSCATSLHNITRLDAFLRLNPDQFHLYFFYNCSNVPPFFTYTIPCATHSNLYTYAAFQRKGGLSFFNASSENCVFSVAAPIDVDETVNPDTLMKLTYKEVLKMGFFLEWNSSSDCGKCEKSGGRCGFSTTHDFVCFCRDGPHSRSCKSDWHFEACKPQNCGRGPNISCPSRIDVVQELFCGYPGFELSGKDREPIREKFQEKRSLLVSREPVWDSSCSSHS